MSVVPPRKENEAKSTSEISAQTDHKNLKSTKTKQEHEEQWKRFGRKNTYILLSRELHNYMRWFSQMSLLAHRPRYSLPWLKTTDFPFVVWVSLVRIAWFMREFLILKRPQAQARVQVMLKRIVLSFLLYVINLCMEFMPNNKITRIKTEQIRSNTLT